VKLLVDTGVFSAALSRKRRPEFEPLVARLPGNQLNLAAQSVAELRYGALLAGWGGARAQRLERAIETVNVIPVSDALLSAVARFRFACRTVGHPLSNPVHHEDLWIAATAVHIGATLVTADGVFNEAPGLSIL
jgi:tRNA(fMet)-specific endonuclease VapC